MSPQVAAETWTVYDGLNPYADFDGSGSLTHRYLYGPAVDMILARLDSSDEVAWYLSDHLGSVRDVADRAGTVIDHVQYDSFGNSLAETNPSAGDRFKFTGREYDEATGQYYYRARYYDPAMGRFISQDPIGFQAGDANLYRYVGNHPTQDTDPTGQDWRDEYIWKYRRAIQYLQEENVRLRHAYILLARLSFQIRDFVAAISPTLSPWGLRLLNELAGAMQNVITTMTSGIVEQMRRNNEEIRWFEGMIRRIIRGEPLPQFCLASSGGYDSSEVNGGLMELEDQFARLQRYISGGSGGCSYHDSGGYSYDDSGGRSSEASGGYS